MNKYSEGTNVVCMQNDIHALEEELESCDEVINELIHNNAQMQFFAECGCHEVVLSKLQAINNKYKIDNVVDE